MKFSRLVLCLCILSSLVWGRTYSSTFQTTQNPLSESGNWIGGKTAGLDWNDLKVVTAGLAQTAQTLSASGFDDGTALVSGSWGPDQDITIHVKAPSTLGGTQEVEIRLRSSFSAHQATGYEVDFTTGGLYLVRWNGPGPFTSTCCLTTLGSANVKYANGDTLRATIVGTVITVYRNGASVLTHNTSGDTTPTDGSGGAARYSTGAPGIGVDINSVTASTDFGITSFSVDDGVTTNNPVINSFTATPSTINSGSSSTLAWTTSNATSVSINQGIGGVAVDGNISVSPTTSTTYTLTATGNATSVTSSVTVTVSGTGSGGTIAAASCNASAVQAALNSVTADNTTVSVPAGTCIWTAKVTYNQVYSTILAGQTTCSGTPPASCSDITIITDNTGSGLFNIVTASGKTFRMTGLTFKDSNYVNCSKRSSSKAPVR